MITELSTIRPKSIAPRLIRLPAMPARSIRSKAKSIESGIAGGHDQPGPQVAEEDEEHGDDEERPLEEVLLHRVQHVVDERRCGRRRSATSTPVGQGLPDLLQPGLEPRRDVVAVLAHQHEAEAEHDLALAVGGHRAAADLAALDRRARRRARGWARRRRAVIDDVLDVRGAGDDADPLDQVDSPAWSMRAAADVARCSRSRASTSSVEGQAAFGPAPPGRRRPGSAARRRPRC